MSVDIDQYTEQMYQQGEKSRIHLLLTERGDSMQYANTRHQKISSRGKRKVLKKILLLILVLGITNSTLAPSFDILGGQTGVIQAQASSVYKTFYIQGGLFMFPGTCYHYAAVYMKKGDAIQFCVSGNGTLKFGICSVATGTKYGVQRSGTFAVTLIVPSSGYYKVFFMNTTSKTITYTGVVTCSR